MPTATTTDTKDPGSFVHYLTRLPTLHSKAFFAFPILPDGAKYSVSIALVMSARIAFDGNGLTTSLFFFCIYLFRDTRTLSAGYRTSIRFDFEIFDGGWGGGRTGGDREKERPNQ